VGKTKAIKVRRLSMADARASLSKIAKHAHVNGEYFFVGGNGAPMIGIMDAEEMEDYLELRDPAVQARIEKSNEDIRAGRTRPASQLLEEARKELVRKTTRRQRAK
jgi:PHD/YefM family antitoxin component YafN of YafNO toxin-antitoxin module